MEQLRVSKKPTDPAVGDVGEKNRQLLGAHPRIQLQFMLLRFVVVVHPTKWRLVVYTSMLVRLAIS